MSRLTLQRLADNLIREWRKPFNADDFAEKIQQNWSRKISDTTLKRLKRKLSLHDHLIGIDPNGYLPYQAVFAKIGHIPLYVTLGKFEMARKIFLAGHRLIPFISSDLDESDLTLLGPDGNPIPKRKQSFLIEDVIHKFQYSGSRHFPDDIQVNEWLPGKSSLLVTVWDIGALVADLKCRQGDALFINLVDYDKGIFKVSLCSKNLLRSSRLRTRSLNRALEAAILQWCEEDEFSSSRLEKQLLRALFFMKEEFLSIPGFSLVDFLESARDLTVVDHEEGGLQLVPMHKADEYQPVRVEAPRVPKGKTGSLDAIFRDLGLAFTELEFRSILYTVMSTENYGVESAFQMLFGGEGKLFYSKNQHDIFYQYLRKMLMGICEDLKKPESRLISDLRNEIVGVKLSLIGILRFLEKNSIGLQDLPQELLDEVIDLDHFCGETLSQFAYRPSLPELKFVQEARLALKIILPHVELLEEEVYQRLGFY